MLLARNDEMLLVAVVVINRGIMFSMWMTSGPSFRSVIEPSWMMHHQADQADQADLWRC